MFYIIKLFFSTLVSVSCTRLYRGITINFICKQPLEFYVDKLIVYVQLQRSVHCGWCTYRYGSGQESRQKKQETQTSGKAKELGVNIITQSAVMKNVTDSAPLWNLAKAVHRAKRQSHFVRHRAQRNLKNRMWTLREKYKPLGYVTGVASIETGIVSAESILFFI